MFLLTIMAPPYTTFNALQISSNLASLLTERGMLDSVGSCILPNIMLPHICLWIPEFFRILTHVSLASIIYIDVLPVNMGSCVFTWSVSIFVWCVTIPLLDSRFFMSVTLVLASSFFLVSSINVTRLLKNSSPKHSSTTTVRAVNSLHAV